MTALNNVERVETLCEMQFGRANGRSLLMDQISRGDFFGEDERIAKDWLARKEVELHQHWLRKTPEGAAVRQADAADKSIEVAVRAAHASERSAKYTLWAAIAAAVGAGATAWQAMNTPGSQPVQVIPVLSGSAAAGPLPPASMGADRPDERRQVGPK
jgi:hypothetical protein